ncbi:MAG: tRNA pseudouridine(55) synthase TruB [Candidatus Rokubacteria bacterium 13_2_20CM_2_70_11]|nr:MAG: tRNA pseudouridine(55) synthase TruB [Candidatus Rokubacteria bacterium 13_2_20CM_2_70_11]
MSQKVGASGVLVVDKGPGATSFDVVARVRRQLRVRRVGHAGTLDPGATGVLPVLIGEATKLTPYLVDQDKEYVAMVRFGLTTDTHDISGRVLAETTVSRLERHLLVEACRPFIGRIKQVPPMYSALHHEGRRLYELAREGIVVHREPREVIVRSIVVEEVSPPRATLRVVCGKGTYVRVLAADLGAALGYGAAVERLVRCRVGPFDLADAMPWADVTDGDAELMWSRLKPPESALVGWRRITLDDRAAHAFMHGQAVELPAPASGEDGAHVRVHGAAGALIGVGAVIAGGRQVKPLRILHADRPGTRVLPA